MFFRPRRGFIRRHPSRLDAQRCAKGFQMLLHLAYGTEMLFDLREQLQL
jgi:hypothetical protein